MLRLIFALFAILPIVVFAEPQPSFIVVTPLKTGTHLLTKLVERLVGKTSRHSWDENLSKEQLLEEIQKAEETGQFLHTHVHYSKEIAKMLKSLNYKVLFLMRDPRDVLISMLFHIETGELSYGPMRKSYPYGTLSFDDKLHELITGERYWLSAAKNNIGKQLPWMFEKGDFVYTAHFEKLIGPEGGGSAAAQNKEIIAIAKHIGISLKPADLSPITAELFGGTRTFRSGQIGEWKKYFKPRHVRAFKDVFGKELIGLRYEKDGGWGV